MITYVKPEQLRRFESESSLAASAAIESVSSFIASINSRREHNNPWLASDVESIRKTLTSVPFDEAFVLALDSAKLVGVLGYYPFHDQGLIRLLGPFVASAEYEQISSELWARLLNSIPTIYTKCRVSLDEQNLSARSFFDKLGFTVYNAEAALSLELESLTSLSPVPLPTDRMNPLVTIRSFTSSEEIPSADLEAFARLHPQEAYFSTAEILQRLSGTQTLFLLYGQDRMIGYTYVERMAETNSAEVCFIRVLEEERNKRYGSFLLTHVIHWLRGIGQVFRIDLSVRLENTAARRLYERFGFREVSVCVSMEKSIE